MTTDTKPTFLFVLPWSLEHLGGVNQVVISIAREIDKNKVFRPVVLTSDWNSTKAVSKEINGIKTINWQLREYRPDMKLKERIGFFLWQKKFAQQFEKLCNNLNVVAINFHFPNTTALGLNEVVSKFKKKIPFIFSFHGTDVKVLSKSSDKLLSYWQKALKEQTTVACSKDLELRLKQILGISFSCHVISNGIDSDFFDNSKIKKRDKEQHTTSNTRILNVARFDYNKGQDILIKAFSLVAANYKDIELVLVGMADKALYELKKLALELKIEDKIRFVTDVPHCEIPNFFKQSDIFCLSSRQEGFSLVLLEAASFSKPVIATRVGIVPEVIENGVNGIIVDPENVSELASAMEKLIGDRALREQFGELLSQKVSKNYSWNKTYKNYIKLIAP